MFGDGFYPAMMISVFSGSVGGNSSLVHDQQPQITGQGRGFACLKALMMAGQIVLGSGYTGESQQHATSGAELCAVGGSV